MDAPAVLRVTGTEGDLEQIEALLWWHNAESVATLGEPTGNPLATMVIAAGFTSAIAANDAASALRWETEVHELRDDEWLDAWRDHAVPVPVGSTLIIVPSWLDAPATDRMVISIDPGRSFGSGAHPSTVLALAEIERLCAERTIESVLDVGCGSGVLAIGAVLLGAHRAVGVDIDPIAQLATAENSVRNGCADRMRIAGDELADVGAQRFDLTVANIARPVIRSIWQPLLASAPNVILSGLLVDQAHELGEAARANGRCALVTDPLDGWAAVVIEDSDWA
jgi:ribosomal protein L11 methyltransferase